MANKKKYVDIKDVPLIRVGTWDASTGESTITREDLDDIVEAFESEELNKAVIKIGHTDPRFENPDWDGEPAYGQVDNLRVTDEKDGTLVGDLVNVPSELAEKLDSAYPYRSVEINWGVKLKDAAGKVAKTFKAVLTGLALLGASEPAVSGLGEIHAGFTKLKSDKVQMFTSARFAFDGGHTSESLRAAIQAALREQSTGDDTYWDVWIEDFDDATVQYNSPDGLRQQSYTVEPDGGITLDNTPVRVNIVRTYKPVADADSDTPTVPQAKTSAAKAEDVQGAAGAEVEQEGDTTVEFLEILRTKLGLPDTATEDEVKAALEAANVTPEEAPAEGGAEAQAGAEGAELTPEQQAAADAAAAEAGDASGAAATGTTSAAKATEPTPSVTVSAAAFSALQRDAAENARKLKDLTDKQDKDRRDGIIQSAFKAGKLHPTETEGWRKALDKDEESIVTLLSARHPVFPVQEIGSDNAPHAFSATKVLSEAQIAAENSLFGIGGTK